VDGAIGAPRVRQAVASGIGPGGRGDPAAARRLLAEAGHAGGLVLRIAAPGDEWQGAGLAGLADSLAACGITLAVNAPSTGGVPAACEVPAADLTLVEWTPRWPGEPEPDFAGTGGTGWRVPVLAEACRSCATDAVASGVAP
jgi:hypothetical protein